jgi:hypothetical protein
MAPSWKAIWSSPTQRPRSHSTRYSLQTRRLGYRTISGTASTHRGKFAYNLIFRPKHRQQLKHYDYTSPVMKINIALNQIPNFTCLPNQAPGVGTTAFAKRRQISLGNPLID